MKSFDISAGEGMTVYNDWDDTHGYQFSIMWGHSANIPVTVIMYGGADYGGGITSYAENIPYDLVINLIDKHKNDDYGYDLYIAMQALVDTYTIKDGK